MRKNLQLIVIFCGLLYEITTLADTQVCIITENVGYGFVTNETQDFVTWKGSPTNAFSPNSQQIHGLRYGVSFSIDASRLSQGATTMRVSMSNDPSRFCQIKSNPQGRDASARVCFNVESMQNLKCTLLTEQNIGKHATYLNIKVLP